MTRFVVGKTGGFGSDALSFIHVDGGASSLIHVVKGVSSFLFVGVEINSVLLRLLGEEYSLDVDSNIALPGVTVVFQKKIF